MADMHGLEPYDTYGCIKSWSFGIPVSVWIWIGTDPPAHEYQDLLYCC